MKAKLISIQLTTRVLISEDNDTDEKIAELATPQFINQLRNNEVFENIISITDDTEMPFGSIYTDKPLNECNYSDNDLIGFYKQGWTISYNTSAKKYQVQRIDDAAEWGIGHNIHVPQLANDAEARKLAKDAGLNIDIDGFLI